MPGKFYDRKVLILILVFAIFRFIPATVLELGNDEAYYWLYGQQLQWNYFDHPPMVAVWVRIFTLNGWLDGWEGAVRAGSVVSCALSTWFMYRAGSLIGGQRTGWYTALLFNASLYAGIIAGVLLMPDSPQLFFWTLCLWQVARIAVNEKEKSAWIWLGLCAGLAIMSKVHGVFIWVGLGLYAITCRRQWFRNPMPYVALLLSVAVASPIWIWNMHYDFVTWKFHSARVDIFSVATGKDGMWKELAEQVLVNNPVNVVLIILAFIFLARKIKLHPALSVYNFIALPLILALLVISTSREVWFHWSGPAYTSLLPLAASWMAGWEKKKWVIRSLSLSTAFFIVALIGWPLLVHFYPGTYGSKQAATLGSGDITLDKYGWKKAGEDFSYLYHQENAGDSGKGQTPIVCPTWWGAHLEYYFARPVSAPVIGLGPTQFIHQYSWLNSSRMMASDMDTAIYIASTIEDSMSSAAFYKYYRKREWLATIPVYRQGRQVANFYISRLSGWTGQTGTIAEQTAGGE